MQTAACPKCWEKGTFIRLLFIKKLFCANVSSPDFEYRLFICLGLRNSFRIAWNAIQLWEPREPELLKIGSRNSDQGLLTAFLQRGVGTRREVVSLLHHQRPHHQSHERMNCLQTSSRLWLLSDSYYRLPALVIRLFFWNPLEELISRPAP